MLATGNKAGLAVPSAKYAELSPAQRALVAAFVAIGIWYLAWRPATFNPDAMAFSALVYGAELFGFACAMLYLVMCWRLQRRAPLPVPPRATVAVFVPTINESVDIVRRIDYQKLVIEREQAEKQLALATRREAAAAEQRKQEWRLVEAELMQLRSEVDRSQKAMQELNVTAPRDGIILHQSNWQGEKFDVGSQVFRGQSVAQIPDVSTLIARVAVPETEIRRVSIGMKAKVVVEGGAGQAIEGEVTDIGRAVRSKSRSQLVPVVDAVVSFNPEGQALKPGQPVRVLLVTPTEKQR